MASKLGTNASKIILVVIAVLLIVIVINSSNQPKSKNENQSQTGEPTTNDVTGDNVEETLNKVSSQYLAQQQQTKALQEQLATVQTQLQERNNTQDPESENRLRQILQNEISELRNDFGQLHHSVTGNQPPPLSSPDENQDTNPTITPPNPTNAQSGYVLNNLGDLAGLGFDSKSSSQDTEQTQRLRSRLPGYATIVPLSDKTPESLTETTQTSSVTDTTITSTQLLNETRTEVKPFKTIPARSTLLRAKAMTALVGRIPVSGRIQDPYPVKLIVGSQNLAANGHQIHGLQGIIFDGTAKGDWTLSCVSVDIIGGTYVFDDGRIQHMTRNTGDSIEAASATESQGNRIGYISNPHGLPCIRGKRFTNAYEQAGFISLLNYGSGLFNARAQNETTSVVSGTTGTTTSSVTGDNNLFETNAAVANSINGIREIQEARAQNGIDVIAAPAGQEVAIHITHDLYIDYDPSARRLHYADSRQTHYQPTRLD